MDEFAFLPAQAAEMGAALPPVRRLTQTLPDGRTVSALQYGDPRSGSFPDPAVTFLHGAGLNAHTWDTTVLALGLPALSVDLPGHGDSAWRSDAGYTGPLLAADIAAPLAAWTSTAQILVGQSLGGLTGASLAAAQPDLVDALIIVDITPSIDPNADAAQIAAFFAGPSDWASRDDLVQRALAFGFGGGREATERGVALNSRVRSDGRVEWKHHFAHLAHALSQDPAPAAASQQDAVRAALSASGWDDLAAVRAPITLIRGDRGFVTASDVELFRGRVPGAAVVQVPAGHNVQEDAPALLASLIGEVAAGRERFAADRGSRSEEPAPGGYA